MNDMKEKAMGAVKAFLERKGYGIVDEALAARWLAGNGDDYADTPVRFDEVAMMVVKENRALLRHHINCFGEMEPLS